MYCCGLLTDTSIYSVATNNLPKCSIIKQHSHQACVVLNAVYTASWTHIQPVVFTHRTSRERQGRASSFLFCCLLVLFQHLQLDATHTTPPNPSTWMVKVQFLQFSSQKFNWLFWTLKPKTRIYMCLHTFIFIQSDHFWRSQCEFRVRGTRC